MKKITVILCLLSLSLASWSQETLNDRSDFIPNKVDSNFFYCSFDLSLVFPTAKENAFQKYRLREDAVKGNRLFKGEMEMLLFPMTRYEGKYHPHCFVRIDLVPSFYLSSRLGVGISSKRLGSSVGIFHGTYYRRVPYESNFITRRKRSFENYPLSGFYLQSSTEYANFFFSIAFEKTHNFYSTRSEIVLGEMLLLGDKDSQIRTLGVMMSYETFTGFGVGASISLFEGSRVDVSWIIPDNADVEEQARIQHKLAEGVLVSFRYYVN
jgi:hypothetical protein